MKLSNDCKTLVGWEEVNPLELCRVWNLNKLSFVFEEILDLEDNEDLKEDPSKLIFISNDNNLLFLRGNNKKGVVILSLEDGTKLGEIS